ncbi:AAA family ATPase [Paraburkholderia sp. JPY432]|uniref:trifunctional serine/threonine-protein kinase/ATP-binding protein/sensor histidine kinase n=1 Tax=Paraburkholderia youngii TaxID=2782701 RepID=UPI00159567F4|nr:trifunctional serine/threonine-protein kinase/ATP-binding protein/sensor histidine kinase [Paraburkholderia youngii]NVH75769.1 AAA family ATPase [Paraburkholderia youngii]
MDKKMNMLWDDGERVVLRRPSSSIAGHNELFARLAAEKPLPASIDRLTHEFGLKDELDSAWAVRPMRLVREEGQVLLALEDPGGEPLARLLGAPLELGHFLELATAIAAALGKLHQRGLIHKDVKPAHIFVHCTDGQPRLTGFGLASRLPRERQAPEPPETIAGTLAYMAPEQTGRMNRSIDSRSDLYALGVTFYQMLTGVLPFTATDAMEWVHCHIARTPLAPNARVEAIPAVISRIVMKLLAKTAEERYQTATGVEHDLRRCLSDWQRQRRIDEFPLDEHGTPDRLMIPEKLYGREREVDTLVTTFARILDSGVPELVLVSGYSGIGKSSVVNELHKILVPPRGLFASGKFDQYKRDIPYATLIQAFQSLVRMLLGKSDTELAGWRAALLDALSPNAALMSDLIPELKLIIGESPPVPELEPQQAKQRFLQVFRRFIGVFAQADHPLALFLDDLQWLDAGTLDLLADLLIHPELRYLMVIGAYRDNEVDAAHPLSARLQAIRDAGAKIGEIQLAPLTGAHIGNLISDALRCAPDSIEPLARLVCEKTGGNPFFVIQFLQALAEGNLLAFDHVARQWRWDAERIHARGYTDNVVDLMADKLTRLQPSGQQALQQLACLGNVADIATLSVVLGIAEAQVHAVLSEAVRQELVARLEGAYAFVHDRIHEAAYSLIPQASRANEHLRIGRLLVALTPAEKRDELIFEIVGQLNRGAELIIERDEREQLAELNLSAGRRAKASTAYSSALAYFVSGAGLLSEECWQRRNDVAFTLELNRAECEYLTGQLLAAEERLAELSIRATTTLERAQVACSQMDVYLLLDRNEDAIEVGLALLRHVGIDWSPHPDEMTVRSEYERIGSLLGDRNIEELIDLPPMENAIALATIEVLVKLFGPAVFTDGNLACLTNCKAITLSLEQGNGDASCVAYTRFSKYAGQLFGNYRAGLQFGQLGCKLVERRGDVRYQARTHLAFSVYVACWAQSVRNCGDQLRRIFDVANKTGDLTYGAVAYHHLVSTLLFIGEPLTDVLRDAQSGLAYARKVRFGMSIHFIENQIALIRTLRGLTPEFGCLDDAQFNEASTEQLLSEPSLSVAACWYWIRKLQALYLAGDQAAAAAAASKAERLLWTSHSFLVEADYHFYAALARAANCQSIAACELPQHLEALSAHHNQLRVWADVCPDNFAGHCMLVGAEIARLEGRATDAEMLYEQAIHSAQQNSFAHVEALASELASRFYAARGLRRIARMYMRDARYGYLRWGANAKVRQLDEHYAYLRTEETVPGPTNTMAAPIEHLELATVIKVSEAASGEIRLEKLIEMVMRTAIEQAGAERSLLILPDGNEHRVAAEGITSGNAVHVHLSNTRVTAAVLPVSILNQVFRTREAVFVDDAATDPVAAADPYVRQRRARSILCLPLTSGAKHMGALYLENNLTARVFSATQIAVLKLVASQAAISLENARLYRDVAERESKIRRLVDSNVIGIVIWDLDGRLVDANDSFLRMVQYDREDLSAGMRWFDMTPPEWQEAHVLDEVEELKSTGTMQPREKEFFRKDGTRVPVLIGAAAFEDEPNEGVAYILDLTDLKRAEEAARISNGRYRELLYEMAHVNRIATVGQLSAAISHDVRQPLAGVVTSGSAGLNWLAAKPPNIKAAQRALERVISEGHRAAEVLERTRALVKKVPPKTELASINAIISQAVDLIRGEAARKSVLLHLRLETDVLPVFADPVQLQQVIVNLVMNAIEAMSETPDAEGDLSVLSFSEMKERIRVEIRDTGPGVSDDALDKLFHGFYSTKSGGMGMGLAISRSIIEAHGGELWVKKNEPRGAVFAFSLPVARDHGETVKRGSPLR